jgi:hypothetical protein
LGRILGWVARVFSLWTLLLIGTAQAKPCPADLLSPHR